MIEFLPKDVLDGLREAHLRNLVRKSRIKVRVGDEVYPVLRIWKDGFALALEDAPKLRGLVELYEGARQMSQCLIVASSEDGELMNYEFKRNTATAESPALDFVQDDMRPVALLNGPGY